MRSLTVAIKSSHWGCSLFSVAKWDVLPYFDNTSQNLSHLIFTTVQRGRCYYSHFAIKKTEAQPVGRRARIQTQNCWTHEPIRLALDPAASAHVLLS